MMIVRITAGIYGLRDAGGHFRPVPAGELAEVPDGEAARLVSLGVAVIAGGELPAEAPRSAVPPADTGAENGGSGEENGVPGAADEHPEPESIPGPEEEYADGGGEEYFHDDLREMTVTELRIVADVEGVSLAGLRRKDDIIAAIEAQRAAVPEPEIGGLVL